MKTQIFDKNHLETIVDEFGVIRILMHNGNVIRITNIADDSILIGVEGIKSRLSIIPETNALEIKTFNL